MDHQKAKRKRQLRRRHHVRRTITGTPERPRLTVFRSSKHIYAQLIDDLSGVTLAAACSLSPEVKANLPYGGNIKAARAVGAQLAAAAQAKGITKAAFDRGHYKFHGRVKALAEAANEAGLKCTESRKPRPAPVEEAPKKAEKPAKEKKAKKEKAPAPA
ncbi:MAG TPA: 50S ribosomal protein L18 [Gemmataceae bacterium]|nr:50S ribosomal protein L18 [Gemmataceae bacterium]